MSRSQAVRLIMLGAVLGILYAVLVPASAAPMGSQATTLHVSFIDLNLPQPQS